MSRQSENVAWGIAAGVIFLALAVWIGGAVLANGKDLAVALIAGLSIGISAAGAVWFYKHAVYDAGMEQSNRGRRSHDDPRPPDDFQDWGDG